MTSPINIRTTAGVASSLRGNRPCASYLVLGNLLRISHRACGTIFVQRMCKCDALYSCHLGVVNDAMMQSYAYWVMAVLVLSIYNAARKYYERAAHGAGLLFIDAEFLDVPLIISLELSCSS